MLEIPRYQPFNFDLHNASKQSSNSNNKITIVTPPKCGTHLLNKVVKLLGVNVDKQLFHFYNEALKERGPFCEIIGAPIKLKPNRKYITIYRDPRDALLSYVKHFQKKIIIGKGLHDIEKLTQSECVDAFLETWENPSSELWRGIPCKELRKYSLCFFSSLNAALELKNNKSKNLLAVQFEKLIPKFSGGKSNNVRFKMVEKISKFISSNKSQKQISKIIPQIWGETQTFDNSIQKKVNKWQDSLSIEQIKKIKEQFNYLIMGLGYETNPNWDLEYVEPQSSPPLTCPI